MQSLKYVNALRPHSIKNLMNDWETSVSTFGWKPFWNSFIKGQYIKKDNIAAQTNRAKLGSRKIADIKEKVILRRGKYTRILFNRITGAIIPTKGLSLANTNKLATRNKRAAKHAKYFAEDNHLDAVAAMLKFPRNMRRTLFKKLSNFKNGWKFYCEAEKMIREG
jgi:hypothetical protein